MLYACFLSDAGVTVQGTIPSFVKAWKSTGCMDGLNWTSIKAFAMTGETSNVHDDLWLSSKSYYKPIIESYGGTKLSSSYIQGNHLQPQAFAAFSSTSMSTDFVIFNEDRHAYPDDEPCEVKWVYIVCIWEPLIDFSTPIMMRSTSRGSLCTMGRLRRHSDILKRTVGGFLMVQGRVDDTMNLGGIKPAAKRMLPFGQTDIGKQVDSSTNQIPETLTTKPAQAIAPEEKSDDATRTTPAKKSKTEDKQT